MAVFRQFTQLDGSTGTKNPFPNATYGSVLPDANTKNTYAKGTRENIAFRANFESGSGIGGMFAQQRDQATLLSMGAPTPAPVVAAPVAATPTGPDRLERVQIAQEQRATALVARKDRLFAMKPTPVAKQDPTLTPEDPYYGRPINSVSQYNNRGFSGSVGGGLVTTSSWVD